MELGSNNILQFLKNKTILVTGATGFLAKIFVEKIIRVQPNVKKLYLLLRAADHNSALQRFNSEVIAKDLFTVVKEKMGANFSGFISDKIRVVAGDITEDNLGVNDPNLLEEMWKQVDVVINLAATTNFDERYDVALRLNTFGAEHVLKFSKKCVKLQVHVHVSTAYVCGEGEGLILESPYQLGETLNGAPGLDIDSEKKVVEEKLNELRAIKASDSAITLAMKDLGILRARKYGWPNTYVFTKAMGEMVVGHHKGDIPLVIIRPTIVTSTCKEPFPGWLEGVRTIDSFAVGYGKGRLTCFPGDPHSILDLIPADMVVNAMIAASVAHANQPSETIYQIGSSLVNPVRVADARDYIHRYFTNNPWVNKDGKPIKVGNPTILGTMDSFRRYIAVRYLIPLKGLQIVNTLSCQYFGTTYFILQRKINFLMRLSKLYEPYLFFQGVFDDINTEKLRGSTSQNKNFEADIFYFDPKCIDWEDYFIGTHIPGLVKYVF